MADVNSLFFELIQVAIGTRVCLSHTPKASEWQTLYDMALKQSLVGICFAGVQRLVSQQQAPPEMLYLKWMGMAAKIQQRNENVNRQCVEVQRMLTEAGFRSAILKGQGIGSLYRIQKRGDSTAGADPSVENVEKLALLRQSGDIDIWVDGGMERALEWCREKYGKVEFDYINAHVPVYTSTGSATATEVELHWRAQAITNLVANRKLQKWLEREDVKAMMIGGKARLGGMDEGLVITIPTAEFNAFYILLHCYHHMFESGLGLRQLMDYYFVLVAYANENTSIGLSTSSRELSANFSVNALLEVFGMMRFAKAVMWIMKTVFVGHKNTSTSSAQAENECLYLGIEPDECEGRFLLKEVMQNGNFGHHDERIKKVGGGKMCELWRNVQHNWHLASRYPSEFLWQPIWLIYHFIWKRNLKLKIR